MLHFFSGVSDAVNSAKAIRESLESAMGDTTTDVSLVIVHSTMGHNLKQLLAGTLEACPGAEIVGCTGSGVIGNSWVSEKMRAVAVMTVTGDEFAVASVNGINGENSEDLARKCAEELKSKQSDINMIMVMGPGLNVNGDGIISGIEAVFKADIPILGALAGFSGKDPRTPVFHGELISSDMLVLVGLADPDLKLIQGAHHGSLPQEDYRFTVTKAQSIRVDEFNGKPAWPEMMDTFSMSPETISGDIIELIGLGEELDEIYHEEYDNKHILHSPLSLSEDKKSVFFQTEIAEGTTLVSCQRNEEYMFNGVDRLTDRLKERLTDSTPVAIFHTDCMARGRMAYNLIEKNEIISKIQKPFVKDHQELITQIQDSFTGSADLPWLGVYGFAEFCMINGRNLFHNYTTSLSIIVRSTNTS